jgi:hypothetical protein
LPKWKRPTALLLARSRQPAQLNTLTLGN